MAKAHAKSSRDGLRYSILINTLIRKETREKDKPRAVTINTMPLWLSGVIMVRGADSPGGRPPVEFDAIKDFHKND